MAFGLLEICNHGQAERNKKYKLPLALQIQCAALQGKDKCEIRKLEKVPPKGAWPVKKGLNVLTSKSH